MFVKILISMLTSMPRDPGATEEHTSVKNASLSLLPAATPATKAKTTLVQRRTERPPRAVPILAPGTEPLSLTSSIDNYQRTRSAGPAEAYASSGQGRSWNPIPRYSSYAGLWRVTINDSCVSPRRSSSSATASTNRVEMPLRCWIGCVNACAMKGSSCHRVQMTAAESLPCSS